ncbi:MAG TPA: T9SS type A sorting domain-containing protein [Flavobacteriales bacterium]|nr:T9SS type A sorting domain-containing protein [Flavobacteriales bacterium]
MNLTINNSTATSTSITVCDSYTWLANSTTYTTSGTYTNISITTAGCTLTETLVLTINNSSSSSTYITACDSYSWNLVTYTNSGVYTYTTTNANGCDSIATLNLVINGSPVTPIITQPFATTLAVSNGPFPFYQWKRNSIAIAGATSSTLNVFQAGMYSVEVTSDEGCRSESAGFPIGVTGISEEALKEFKLYPNPTREVVFLQTPQRLGTDYAVELYDSQGKRLWHVDIEKLHTNELMIKMANNANGFYQIIIRYANGDVWNQKLIKQ